MTPDLAQFSDWVLALLPRLLIYPGGIWLLVGVLLARLAGGGLKGIMPRSWLHDFLRTNLPSLAIAWTALALMPLPGAQTLPVPVDRWVLAVLLALSLLLDVGAKRASLLQAGAAITLAVLSPLAGGTSLLVVPADYLSGMPWAFAAEIAAVALGLAVILWLGGTGLATEVRGLAWLALALLPLFGAGDAWPTITLWVFGAAVLVWFVAGRLKERVVRERASLLVWAQAILWLLGFLALAGPLLAAR